MGIHLSAQIKRILGVSVSVAMSELAWVSFLSGALPSLFEERNKNQANLVGY